MSFFFDTHIIYHQIDYTSFFFFCLFFFGISCLFLLIYISNVIKLIWCFSLRCQIEVMHQYTNFLENKSKHVLLKRNGKSKWTRFPLINQINCKPLQRRFFSSHQIAHMFLGLTLRCAGHLKHDFKIQSIILTSSPQLSGQSI